MGKRLPWIPSLPITSLTVDLHRHEHARHGRL
jgi:hypothetical protein